MPENLRVRTIELAHEDHPGITVMKRRIAIKVINRSGSELLIENPETKVQYRRHITHGSKLESKKKQKEWDKRRIEV